MGRSKTEQGHLHLDRALALFKDSIFVLDLDISIFHNITNCVFNENVLPILDCRIAKFIFNMVNHEYDTVRSITQSNLYSPRSIIGEN